MNAPIMFPRVMQETPRTVTGQMQTRRKDALCGPAPSGEPWETAGMQALRDLLHLVPLLTVTPDDLDMVREARLLLQNYDDAKRQYARENR